MRRNGSLSLGFMAVFAVLMTAGCGGIFPVWPANYFDEPPAEQGPYTVSEKRFEIPEGADGAPTGITVFAPEDADGPRPVMLWIMGSNVQAYYHQSLHETLASWGYAVIVSDGRPLTFTDFNYHARTIDLARQAFDLAASGELEVSIDTDRVAAGGYSIGATMSLFAAALDDRIDAVVLWAPTGSPFWTGVQPDALYPQVTAPAYFLLGELDHIEPPDGFPKEVQEKLTQAEIAQYIIPQGLHLYFQQPTGADNITDPESSLTRFEQQGIAIERTRTWLDEQFGLER